MRRRTDHRLKRAAIAVLALAGALIAGTSHAMSFAEAYAAARNSDPNFRSAGFELESQRQAVPIARSNLLPQVNVNVSRADVSGSRSFYNGGNQEVRTQLDYSSPQSSLQARMALFNREASKRYEQAQAQVDVAESVYRSRALELIDRLGTAYMQVLLADENKVLADAQLVAAQAQLTRAEQRFKRGEGTRTEQALAQAQADVSRVRVIEAADAREVARRGLKRLIGRDVPPLNQPAADFMPGPLEPGGLFEWIEIAVRNSATVRAREQSVMVARLNIERQSAAHYPRLDLVASISRNENDSVNNLGQTNILKSLGMQLSVPIYSGGGIDASVKQAVAERQRAEEDLRAERETVELEVQRNFQNVVNGAERVQAYKRAAESSEVAYRGAVRAQEAGLGTTADVLDALSRQYLAQRDLAQSRYEYLLSRLRLQSLSGLPIDEVVSDSDRLLNRTPAPAPTKP